MHETPAKSPRRPTGVLVVAILVIVFGLGEIWVGLFGNYLGILSKNMHPSAATVIVGGFYSVAGAALLITRRAWGTFLSLFFIAAEVFGRVYLVVVGVAPSRGADLFKIIIGGIIAIGFMMYIGWRSFSNK